MRGPKQTAAETPEFGQAHRETLLAALSEGQTWASAAAAADTTLNRLYKLRQKDPDFGALCLEARAVGRRMRAAELETVLHEGAGRAGKDPRFTAQLLFSLTNLAPGEWRNRAEHQIDGRLDVANSGTVTHRADSELAGLLQAVIDHSGPATGQRAALPGQVVEGAQEIYPVSQTVPAEAQP